MIDEQKSKFLDLMKAGMGRGFACAELGITLRTLSDTMRADRDFRDRVETAEAASRDTIEQIVANDALSGNVSSALALRALQLRVQAQAESKIIERQKLRARQLEVKAKVKA